MVCSRGRDESAGGVGAGELLFCQLFGFFFQVVGGYFGYSRVVRCKDTALSAERRPIQEGGLSRNNECRVKQDVK